MAAERTRSLEFAALGLGQGGGNLAAEFQRLGYRAAALNTARVDLRALAGDDLAVPESNRLYIGLNELDGAGKDPAYGRACLEAHADAIRELAKREFEGCDAVLLCAGLGGGTGSCLAELCDVLAPLDLPLCALVTLPSESESGIVKVNAVRAASALISRPLLARLFVDNQRILEDQGQLDLMSYYPEINRAIVAPLATLNGLNLDPEATSLRSFDGEDLRKVLLSGGVVSVGSATLELKKPPLTAEQLDSAARDLIDGGKVLAAGLALDKVAYLGLVLVAPEAFLRGTPVSDLEELAERLKQETKGGAVYLGLYAAAIDKPVLHLVAGSLSLPERVASLLEAAKAEGHLLADKIQTEIPPLDVAELADLQLFRGAVTPPRRRASQPDSAPMPAKSKPSKKKAAARPKVEPAVEPEPEPDLAIEPLPDPEADLAIEPLPEPELPRADPPRGSLEVTAPAAEIDGADLEGFSSAGPMTAAESIDYDNLQALYSNLIERFREAPDRRAREEVARRLIHDARADDPEIRAHAVWAMVSLGGRGFKAALQQAAQDPDEEIRSLAEDGLRRLGEGG